MFVYIEYSSKKGAVYLRNIMYISTFEVVAVWVRLSFLDITFYFKPRNRFASQIIRSDVNRDMTRKNQYVC